jgi:two-component system, cell cycle response regulator
LIKPLCVHHETTTESCSTTHVGGRFSLSALAHNASPASIALALATQAESALVILLSLTEKLTEDLPLEDYLTVVTNSAVALLQADHASIRLVSGDRLISSARSGSGTSRAPAEFRRGEGIIGWVIDNKEPAMVADVQKDPRYRTYQDQSFTIRSMLAEPLWSANEVIGALSVTSPEVDAFTPRHQLLTRLLANCSAPAIERARLSRLAMFDHLTMAFNHRYLLPRMREEMGRACGAKSELSVLLLDLDHFKSVNDRFGHAVGDEVLKQVADRIRASVRKVDVLVRRGGEEFVLIMPSTDHEQAKATASRIRARIGGEQIHVEGHALKQTVSIGVATWDGDETPEALELRADQAMYVAKKEGRDRIISSPPSVRA